VHRELAAEDRTRQVLGSDRFGTLVALLESARDALLEDAAADRRSGFASLPPASSHGEARIAIRPAGRDGTRPA
jgi:hypothetical protein